MAQQPQQPQQNPRNAAQDVDGMDEPQLREQARQLGLDDTLDANQLRDQIRQQQQ